MSPSPPNTDKEIILGDTIIDTDSEPGPTSPLTTGAIIGKFEINADGSASYTISLEVPPGRNGMQPELALAYNSYNGNGILGMGWTLKGQSRIYRCNKTLALDGEIEAIKFENNDRLCLDGDYLIEVKGKGPVYDIEAEVFAEFRPEHDPFTRVFVTSTDGLGYASFTVIKKNGLILRYGKSNETRIVKNRQIWTANMTDRNPASLDESQLARYAWLLEEVEDRNGNGMYYEYNEYHKGKVHQGGEKLLSAIRYTYRKSDPPDPSSNNYHPPTRRSVRFFYDENHSGKLNTIFISGIPFDNSNLMRRIEMWAPDPFAEHLVKSYKLEYNNDNPLYINPVSYDSKFTNKTRSGHNLLVSIQECDSKDVCKIPTSFEYERGGLWMSEFENIDTGITGLDSSDPSHWGMIVADINGDGMDDILYRRKTGTNHYGWAELTWYYRLSTGEGFDSEIECGLPIQVAFPNSRARVYNVIPADIDGDGKTELAFPMSYRSPDNPDFWRYYKFTEVSPGEMKFQSLENPSDSPGESSFDLAEQQACVYGNCTDAKGGGRLFFVNMKGNGLPEILHNVSLPLDGEPSKRLSFHNAFGALVLSHWGLRRNNNGNLAESLEIMSDLPSGDPNDHGTRAYRYLGDPKLVPIFSNYVIGTDGGSKEALLFLPVQAADRYEQLLPPGPVIVNNHYQAAKMSSSGNLLLEDTTLLIPDVATTPLLDNAGVHPEWLTENYYYFFVDLNSDGNTDALKISRDGGDPQIIWNTGAGFSEPIDVEVDHDYFGQPLFGFGPRMQENGLFVIDIDQDGLPEFLILGVNSQLFHGIGFTTPFPYLYKLEYDESISKYHFKLNWLPMLIDHISDFIPAYDYASPELTFSHMLDVDGNGIMDFVWLTQNDDATRSIHLYKQKEKKPDFLTGVCEGSGAHIHISYKSMMGRSDDSSSVPYPSYSVARGLWVVSEYSVDRGDLRENPVYTNVFHITPIPSKKYEVIFSQPRFDMHGRGFIGFSQRVITDEQSGLEWTTYYDNVTRIDTSYPYAYLPQQEVFKASMPSGRTFARTTTTKYEYHPLQGPFDRKPFSVVPIDITQTEEENSETLRNFHIFNLVYDDYDNLKHRTLESTTDGYVQTWEATYDYTQVDSRWLVTLLSNVVEQSTITVSGISKTRTRQYVPNHTTGLTHKVIIEPTNTDRDLYLNITYNYDSDGNVENVTYKTWPGASRKVSFTYENDNTTLKTISHFLDNSIVHTTSLIYHPAYFLLAYKIDPDGVYTQWKYDGFGRNLLASPSNGSDLKISYHREPHNYCGYLVKQVDDGGGGTINVSYDQLGRPWHLEKTIFSGGMSENIIDYDPFFSDKASFVSDPFLGTSSPSGLHAEYDLLGRVISTRDEKDKDLHYEFEYTSLKTTIYSVLGDGNNAIKTKIRYYIKDSFDRIVQNVDMLYYDTGEYELSTFYSYGLFGQLESITDNNGNKTIIQYDDLGRRTSLTDPDTGKTVFRYNGFGEIRSKSTPNISNGYFYDKLDRLRSIQDRGGTIAAFDWDGSSTPSTGKISTTTSSDGIQESFEYDNKGRHFKTTWDIDGHGTFDLRTDYDAYGRISLLYYPTTVQGFSLVLKYIYSSASGKLEKIVDNNSGVIYWKVNDMDESDFVKQETLGNKTVITRTLDDVTKALNQIRTLDSEDNVIQDLKYTYYDDGKLQSQEDLLSDISPASAKVEKFEYDTLNRLRSWSDQTRWSYKYHYDYLGNLDSKTMKSIFPLEEKITLYNPEGTVAGPHAITDTSFGKFFYNKIGNQIAGPENREIKYNVNNLPTHLVQNGVSVDFRYDAVSNRVVKESTYTADSSDPRKSWHETIIYIGNFYEKRIQGNITRHVFHISSPNRLVAQIILEERDNATYKYIFYFHDDRLGSTHTITDELGKVFGKMKFDPFGNLVDPSNPLNAVDTFPLTKFSALIRRGFTGHEHDYEVNLINMKGRIYDPNLQRFLTADPSISQPYFGQAFNRYSYVLNNPTNLTDPSGFDPEEGPDKTVVPAGTEFGPAPFGMSPEDWSSANYSILLNKTHESFYNRNWMSDAERRMVTSPPCPNCHNLSATGYHPNDSARVTIPTFNENEIASVVPFPQERTIWNRGGGTLAGGGLALGFGYAILASNPAGWVVGLSGALLFGTGIVGTTAGVTQLATTGTRTLAQDEQMNRDISTPLSVSSSPLSLAFGTAGMLYTGDEEGLRQGALYGGLAEAGGSLAYGVGGMVYREYRFSQLYRGSSYAWDKTTKSAIRQVYGLGNAADRMRPNPLFWRGSEYVDLSHFFSRNSTKGYEFLFNRPWNVTPMWATEHAMVDPQRFNIMLTAFKNAYEAKQIGGISRVIQLASPWMRQSAYGAGLGVEVYLWH